MEPTATQRVREAASNGNGRKGILHDAAVTVAPRRAEPSVDELGFDPEAKAEELDTDVLFPETYETKNRLEERYGINFHRYSSITLEQQKGLYGDELWSRDPDACCGIRKVEPMRSALAAVDLWVSGIRRSDSQTRAKAPKFSWDKRFGLWKLNPLADWSEDQVWAYIQEHDVPYNTLHDQGYPSIGCTHCTRKPAEGEDARAGRWAGLEKTECGLHG
jgi:phosphoadenosine phosphosulfate reductase